MAITATKLMGWVRFGLFALILAALPVRVFAAPYAALVMDMRSGEILYSKNADTRLHPASLTKMMTLYITFQAVERGEISLDQMVTVSANAASQPPSRLGLRAGQKIAVRYLIRAAAVKSANDAAAALGDALGGNQARFAERMNRTAKALGMRNTTFRNANGLTQAGHLSTASDMTILGRHLFYDFPQYYNIFSRKTADAGMAKVYNTNRRFLNDYEGADGIKTGYTVAAGFNLTASAKRGNKRIIATVFGGSSTAQRNAKMAELLDLGFKRASGRSPENRPSAPAADTQMLMASNAGSTSGLSAQRIRVSGAVSKSPFPKRRPGVPGADADAIQMALAQAQAEAQARALAEKIAADVTVEPEAVAAKLAEADAKPEPEAEIQLAEATAPATGLRPMPRPSHIAALAPAPAAPEATQIAATEPVEAPVEEEATALAALAVEAPVAQTEIAALAPAPAPEPSGFAQSTEPQPETLRLASAMMDDILRNEADVEAQGDAEPAFVQSTEPQPETRAARSDKVILAALTPPAPAPHQQPKVVARASSSGGRGHGVSLGYYNSKFAAERALLTIALMETDTLGEALRKVASRPKGFEANFVGMSRDMAELACARLTARAQKCSVIGP
ncbi:MAG: D-alanyl-D-alanine carboxypeptidase family protein [Paracoccaceae bacterium]